MRLPLQWALPVVLVGLAAAAPSAAFDLYFVRHAETVANATGIHSPANERAFSPAGLRQAGELEARLAGVRFDAVVVSPLWRAQHTILPYLRKRALSAEIWPELAECCWQRDQDERAAPVRAPGPPIMAEDALLRLRGPEAAERLDAGENRSAGVARVGRTAELLVERYGDKPVSVLVVGHYWHGARLLRLLLGEADGPEIRPENGRPIHLRQDPGGRFRLVAE